MVLAVKEEPNKLVINLGRGQRSPLKRSLDVGKNLEELHLRIVLAETFAENFLHVLSECAKLRVLKEALIKIGGTPEVAVVLGFGLEEWDQFVQPRGIGPFPLTTLARNDVRKI